VTPHTFTRQFPPRLKRARRQLYSLAPGHFRGQALLRPSVLVVATTLASLVLLPLGHRRALEFTLLVPVALYVIGTLPTLLRSRAKALFIARLHQPPRPPRRTPPLKALARWSYPDRPALRIVLEIDRQSLAYRGLFDHLYAPTNSDAWHLDTELYQDHEEGSYSLQGLIREAVQAPLTHSWRVDNTVDEAALSEVLAALDILDSAPVELSPIIDRATALISARFRTWTTEKVRSIEARKVLTALATFYESLPSDPLALTFAMESLNVVVSPVPLSTPAEFAEMLTRVAATASRLLRTPALAKDVPLQTVTTTTSIKELS